MMSTYSQTSHWRMLDMSQLPTNTCWLSKEQRMILYNKVSKNFTITTKDDNQHCESVIGLPNSKLASIMTPNTFTSDLISLSFSGIIHLCYFYCVQHNRTV